MVGLYLSFVLIIIDMGMNRYVKASGLCSFQFHMLYPQTNTLSISLIPLLILWLQ